MRQRKTGCNRDDGGWSTGDEPVGYRRHLQRLGRRERLPCTRIGAADHRDEEGLSVKDLVDTTEMYLRTIYDLEEEGVRPLRARIAERLEQSCPTVSQTVARMERDGLLVVTADRRIDLPEVGRLAATRV